MSQHIIPRSDAGRSHRRWLAACSLLAGGPIGTQFGCSCQPRMKTPPDRAWANLVVMHASVVTCTHSSRAIAVCVLCCGQGTGVTSGLRKVTDDMKTKNRADRSGHVTATPAAAAKGAAKPAAAAAAAAKGPPRYVSLSAVWTAACLTRGSEQGTAVVVSCLQPCVGN